MTSTGYVDSPHARRALPRRTLTVVMSSQVFSGVSGAGLAVLADYPDPSLDDIATANLAKLASRQDRGVLGGAGDNR